MKKCTKHSEYFPEEDPYFPETNEYFCKNKGYKNGLQSWCRKCMREYSRRTYNTLRGKLHQMYHNLNRRCSNPLHTRYKDYGGRGIRNRFPSKKAFVDYIINDLGITKLSDIAGLAIDRIDNNSHYMPGNLRFVTPSENQYNRRNCKKSEKF